VRFFFYGTLLDDDVRSLVLGSRAADMSLEPATLHGYCRCVMQRRTYPVISPDVRNSVTRRVIRGLDARMAHRLAAFEGAEFEPLQCNVTIENGRILRTWVFVAGSDAVLSMTPWDLETWQRRHKAEFLRRLRRGAA